MELGDNLRRAAFVVAWSLVLGLVLVTWGPQSLRPHLADAQVERFAAFFVTAAAFVAAYPMRVRLIALAAIVLAVVLELGQFLAPGRDPGVPDAIAKSLGGVCGAFAMAAVLRLLKNRSA